MTVPNDVCDLMAMPAGGLPGGSSTIAGYVALPSISVASSASGTALVRCTCCHRKCVIASDSGCLGNADIGLEAGVALDVDDVDDLALCRCDVSDGTTRSSCDWP